MKNRLAEIHDQLMTISTKGEDSIKMSQCLIALRQVIIEQVELEERDAAETENREDGTEVEEVHEETEE